MTTLGETLRTERLRKEFGLRELADCIGCSVAYLSRVETDSIDCVPSEEILVKLADRLSLPTDELMRLAGRLPADVENYVLENPGVLKRLRREINRRNGGSQ